MKGGSVNQTPTPRRLRRYHLQLAGVTVVAAGLGVGAVALLSDDEAPSEPALAQEFGQPSEGAPSSLALPAPSRALEPAPSAAQVVEPPPPADRPTLAPPPGLPPLATQWRDSILRNRRQGVLHGARSLRDAPDGREQLLALLRDNNGRVRAFALRELGRRRDASLAPVFRACLGDTSRSVVENARWALSELERKATK